MFPAEAIESMYISSKNQYVLFLFVLVETSISRYVSGKDQYVYYDAILMITHFLNSEHIELKILYRKLYKKIQYN